MPQFPFISHPVPCLLPQTFTVSMDNTSLGAVWPRMITVFSPRSTMNDNINLNSSQAVSSVRERDIVRAVTVASQTGNRPQPGLSFECPCYFRDRRPSLEALPPSPPRSKYFRFHYQETRPHALRGPLHLTLVSRLGDAVAIVHEVPVGSYLPLRCRRLPTCNFHPSTPSHFPSPISSLRLSASSACDGILSDSENFQVSVRKSATES